MKYDELNGIIKTPQKLYTLCVYKIKNIYIYIWKNIYQNIKIIIKK